MLIFIIISTSSQPQKDSADRYLSLPQLDKCNNRFKGAQYKNRNFFFSGYDPELKDDKFDWLDSRNTCRERCMTAIMKRDLVAKRNNNLNIYLISDAWKLFLSRHKRSLISSKITSSKITSALYGLLVVSATLPVARAAGICFPRGMITNQHDAYIKLVKFKFFLSL